MYNGEDIPTGWLLCDGSNNAPNMTNQFVKDQNGLTTIVYIIKV